MSVPGESCLSKYSRGEAGKSQSNPRLAPRRGRGANGSDLCVFGKGKRVFHVDPEIAHRILDLAMAEKDLDSTQVAGRPIDDRCLRPPKRVRTIFASHQTDPCYPFIDKAGILTCADMPIVIDPARKDIIVHCAAPALEPRQQAGPSVGKQFELNRPTCFLLHHDCARSDLPPADNVAYFHPHQVAAAELAVDRKVKQCAITQAAVLIEVKPDLPNLFWFQGPLRADGSSGIPDLTLGRSGFGFRHLHDHSPKARLAI